MARDLNFLKEVDSNAPFCTTGKIPHKTVAKALLAARAAKRQYVEDGEINGRRIPARAYKCPECGWFHLTHQKKR